MTLAHGKPDWAQSKRDRKNAERVAQGLKPRRRIVPWIVFAVIAVGGLAFFVTRPGTAVPVAVVTSEAAVQLLQNDIEQIASTTLRETVKVFGTLLPAEQSSVASQASGRVLRVAVRPGDTVAEGDVLVELDRADLELQLAQQRATAEATRVQLLFSREKLERTEQLATRGLITPSALDEARSGVAALGANLAALMSSVQTAELSLSHATVRASLDGVIAERSVEPGQFISIGTALFAIVNLDEMEFQASASATASALVNPGQSVTVAVSGLADQTFAGEVSRVNPIASTGTRAVPIYISIDNPEGLLRGGMFATGLITVEERRSAIAVPATAIREDAEGHFLLKLTDGAIVRHPVEPGETWDHGQIVEVGGLQVGDTVVTAPLAELDPNQPYEIVTGE